MSGNASEPIAAIRHVLHLDPGHHLEQFAGQMNRGSNAARREIDLARIGFCIGDELGNGLSRNRWIDLHHQRHAHDTGNRRDIADEIVAELVVERRVAHIRGTHHEERIAVRVCPHDRLGGDIAAGAWPVLDDELLAHSLGQPLGHKARKDVVRPAGGITDDDAHRSRGISLRPCVPRNRRHSSGARRQMQKLTTGWCHGFPTCPQVVPGKSYTTFSHPRNRVPSSWPIAAFGYATIRRLAEAERTGAPCTTSATIASDCTVRAPTPGVSKSSGKSTGPRSAAAASVPCRRRVKTSL